MTPPALINTMEIIAIFTIKMDHVAWICNGK